MTRGSEPLVSVLVPAFNAEATLAETLRSALASSYSNLELILVDDGSSDGTAAIAETIAREDARVRVVRQEHRGVSAALNIALAQARGDFIARLDADDLWHPMKLRKQVDLMSNDPTLAFTYTYVRYIDVESRILRNGPKQRLQGFALCRCLHEGIIGGGSTVVFRRPALEQSGGYDEQLSVWEDLLLHLKVASAGAIASVPEYLTGYRVRTGSSSSHLARSLGSWRLARGKIKACFPQIPEFVHRWADARRLLEFAEWSAVSGRYGATTRLLAECIARDPVRTLAFLAFRMHRRLSGERRPLHQIGPFFTDADPKVKGGPGEYDVAIERSRLGAIDRSRDDTLMSIDRGISTVQIIPSAHKR